MTRDLFTLGLGLGAILLCVQAARADNARCIERGVLVDRLAAQFGESRQSIGLVGSDRVVEVFASPDTGTWTIIVTAPTGLACLVAAGEHFESVQAEPVGDPA